jgi:molecular chaperone GrpE
LSEDKLPEEIIGAREEPASDIDSDELPGAAHIEDDGASANGEAESEVQVEPSLEEKLEEAEAKAAEYLDGWQRARAEFANARKRLEKGQANAYANAGVDFVSKLLPVLDDFKRALDSAPPEIVEDPWFEGLDLVHRKIQSMLEAMDVQAIEAVGQPFDPTLHEALALREADGVESGIVVEELQTGYQLGDRVIRPALVNVSA